MGDKYVVLFYLESILPERDVLVDQAWGVVPVSYVQDEESFNNCSFLDLKVNKWEVNSGWSGRQSSEPWVRIEVLKGQVLKDFLQNESFSLSVDVERNALIVIEMDEGGGALDDLLLMRLVSVFWGHFKVYRWSNGIEEVSESVIASLPARQTIVNLLRKGGAH